LVNKGLRLGAQDREVEAMEVYDEVVRRFGDATEPALRDRVARALINKGIALGVQKRNAEAMEVYEVVRRFGDATEPALREQVQRALGRKKSLEGGLTEGTPTQA
jgi:hypothetical protein